MYFFNINLFLLFLSSYQCHVSALRVSLPAVTAVVLPGGGSVMEIMTVRMDLMRFDLNLLKG